MNPGSLYPDHGLAPDDTDNLAYTWYVIRLLMSAVPTGSVLEHVGVSPSGHKLVGKFLVAQLFG